MEIILKERHVKMCSTGTTIIPWHSDWAGFQWINMLMQCNARWHWQPPSARRPFAGGQGENDGVPTAFHDSFLSILICFCPS